MNKESFNIIELPKHFDPRGSLTVSEEFTHVPFGIANTGWLYGMTSGSHLLRHAYTNAKTFIVPLSGSFTIKIADVKEQKKLFLNLPNKAIYIDKGVWTEISDCANGTVILVLSDKTEQERTEICQWDQYQEWAFQEQSKHL